MSSFQDLRKKREARSHISAPRTAKRPEVVKAQSVTSSAADTRDILGERGSQAFSQVSSSSSESTSLELNADISIRTVPGRGRGLFWTPADGRSVIQPGTTLFRHTPEINVVSSAELTRRCSRCYKQPAHGLQRCSGCRVLHYCNVQCQKQDWPTHRPECAALRAYGRKERRSEGATIAAELGTSIRLAGRLFWKLKSTPNGSKDQLEALQGDKDASSSEVTELCSYVGEDHEEKLRRTASVVSTNSFAMTTHELDTVGAMVSTYAALLNHACDANACVVWPEGVERPIARGDQGFSRSFSVIARTAIQPGQEITTYYLDPSTPYNLRQRKLERQYGFNCRCTECTHAALSQSKPPGAYLKSRELDQRSVVWCPRAECRGWVRLASPGKDDMQNRDVTKSHGNLNPCTKCKEVSGFDVRVHWSMIARATKVLGEMEDGVAKLDTSRLEKDYGRFAYMLDTVATLVPPSAFPFFAMLQQGFTLSLAAASSAPTLEKTAEYTDDSIKRGLLLIAGMQAGEQGNAKGRLGVVPRGHPYRAMTMANVGCALAESCNPAWQDARPPRPSKTMPKGSVTLPPRGPQRSTMTAAILARAHEELLIAFGKDTGGGIVGRRVMNMLQNAVVPR